MILHVGIFLFVYTRISHCVLSHARKPLIKIGASYVIWFITLIKYICKPFINEKISTKCFAFNIVYSSQESVHFTYLYVKIYLFELHIFEKNISKLFINYSIFTVGVLWARSCENVSYAICEQQRRRSACASAQSDHRLCCSLLG